MSGAVERFVELATRPLLPDNELQFVTAARLRELLEQEHEAPSETDFALAAGRLEDHDRHPWRRRWRKWLPWIVAFVSLPPLLHFCRQCQILHQHGVMVPYPSLPYPLRSLWSRAEPNPHEAISRHLSPSERLLLVGDPAQSVASDRLEPLWKSEPDNPAIHAEYAATFAHDHAGALPPDFLANARRMDPDNGWFPLLAAELASDGQLREGSLSIPQRRKGLVPQWKVSSPANLNLSVALLHEAAAKPFCTSRCDEMLARRLPLLPPRRDWCDQHATKLYLSNVVRPWTFRLSPIVAAHAQRCAEAGDATAFRRLLDDWHKLLGKMTRGASTRYELLVTRRNFGQALPYLRHAAGSLGLADETRGLENLESQWFPHGFAYGWSRGAREPDRAGNPSARLIRDKGSFHARWSMLTRIGTTTYAPVVGDEDLRPGRLADRAVLARVLDVLLWAGLAVLALVTVATRWLHPRPMRELAARMPDLLQAGDWWTILGVGILAPWLYHFLLTRLTPLGGREWALAGRWFPAAVQQGLSLGVLLALTPAWLACRRLTRQTTIPGMRARRCRALRWSTLAAGLALPLPGLSGLASGHAVLVQHAWLALLAIALAGGASVILPMWFETRAKVLTHDTLARTLLPAWLCGMLTLALAMPLHYLEERHWIQQDRLFEITTGPPSISRYESQVTEALRRDLLETLDRGRQ